MERHGNARLQHDQKHFAVFGLYLARNIWEPGVLWNLNGKIPMKDAPDVDLLDVLNAGKPIVETYHRLSTEMNPTLMHRN
jgi:hypothetical protein